MSSKRTAAVVDGCGDTATRVYAPALARGSFERIGWVDPIAAKREALREQHGGTGYGVLGDALEELRPAGVVITTASQAARDNALVAVTTGANVLVEPGTLTDAQMAPVVEAATRHGVTVQMPFEQLLGIQSALHTVRAAAQFRVDHAAYKWTQQQEPGPCGAFEELAVSGIAVVLEAFEWVMPASVKAAGFRGEHYRLELIFPGDVRRVATIHVECGRKLHDPPLVEVALSSAGRRLVHPFRTPDGPERYYQPTLTGWHGDKPWLAPLRPVEVNLDIQCRLWEMSLGKAPMLSVHGERCLMLLRVRDLARAQL